MESSGSNFANFVPSREIHTQLDQALSLRYLSELVTCLNQQKGLSSEQLQEIHLALSPFSKLDTPEEPSPEEKSFLIELLGKPDSHGWLEVLASIHSGERLVSNLYRLSCRELLSTFQQSMGHFGSELLKISKLAFNQPYYVKDSSGTYSKQLFSNLLVDMAMGLGLVLDESKKVEEEFFCFLIPSSLYSSHQLSQEADERLATSLGFKNVNRVDLDFYADRHTRHRLIFVLELWTDLMEEGLDQLSKSYLNSEGTLSSETSQIRSHLEDMKECTPLIKKIRLASQVGNLASLEQRRIKLLSHIRDALSLADKVHFAFLRTIQLYLKTQRLNLLNPAVPAVTKEITKALTLDIVANGVSPEKALEATRAFAKYCKEKSVTRPESILASELFQIHPALGASSLGIIKDQDTSDTMTRGVEEEKSKILSAVKKLEKYFQTALPNMSFLVYLLSCSLLSGCGVKTNPRSFSPELRPSIPFHSTEVSKTN